MPDLAYSHDRLPDTTVLEVKASSIVYGCLLCIKVLISPGTDCSYQGNTAAAGIIPVRRHPGTANGELNSRLASKACPARVKRSYR